MAQFLSSFLIGHISDRVGRRIPLTMGQVASCAGTILFALAPSYSVALLIRGAVGSQIAFSKARNLWLDSKSVPKDHKIHMFV